MSSRASLNHVFRTVWNQAMGAMVAIAETDSVPRGSAGCIGASGSGQLVPSGTRLGALALGIALAWGALAPDALANPAGGVALQGLATFNTSQPNQLLVTTQNGTGTNHSAINWQSFSIGAGETTRFVQPNAASMVINRVVTNTPSALFGTLSSNGSVVLVNQAGIAVGAGAVVDTAGFTASTLSISDADALVGRLRFGSSDLGAYTGALTVQGNLIARSGDVVLIAPNVELAQTAVIEAKDGAVLLAAGRSVEVTGRGLEGITLQVQAPTDQALNLGTLTGNAVGIFAGTLRHSGVIQATTASLDGGKVVLKAKADAYVENGMIAATGTLGGRVDVLGHRVALTQQTQIDASGEDRGGTVRVGGDFQGNNPDVQNASVTYFGPQASIKADATIKGNGGRVIVWSDTTTRAYGSIFARAGQLGGNGGFVETSGRLHLDVNGVIVDASAPRGQIGTWLLDPTNIYIAVDQAAATNAGMPGIDASVDASGPLIFQASGFVTDSLLTTSTLQSALANNNVVIDTSNNSGYGAGVISVVSPVSWSNANALTLNADGSINVNAPMTAPLGTLNLNAGSGYGAAITQGTGAPIAAAALTATTNAQYANITLNEVNSVGTASFRAGPTGYGGYVSFTNSGALILGNVVASGLTLDTSAGNGTITQAAGSQVQLASSADFDAGSGDITLTNAGNSLYSLGIARAGAVNINDAGGDLNLGTITTRSLTLAAQGNIYSYSPITMSGKLDLRTSAGVLNLCGDGCAIVDVGDTVRLEASGDLTYGSVTSQASGDAVTLISTSGFLSPNQTNGGIATPNGRALAYLHEDNSCGAVAPASCHYFGDLLPVFKQYNTGYGSAVLGSGNGVIYSDAAFLSGGLTGSISKTYDAGTGISLVGASFATGNSAPVASNGDNLASAQIVSGTGVLADQHVGSGKLVSATQMAISGVAGTEASNLTVYGYGFNSNYVVSGNIGTVIPAVLTVTGTAVANKTYDGGTTATLSGGTLQGVVGGENVTLSQAGSFVSKDAATGISVTAADSLGGTANLNNYTLVQPTGLSADITPKALIVSGTAVANKPYDGNTTAALSGGTLVGVISGENVTLTQAGNFADKNAATSIAVTVADSLSGSANLNNYTLVQPTGLRANITPKTLTASVTAPDKVYDGNASATPTLSITSGLVGFETLGVSGTASFNSKDVVNANLVTVNTVALADGANGGLASNYSLAAGETVTAHITPLAITGAITASSKVYDGTTLATISATNLIGAITGDGVSYGGGTATFSDRNAAPGKTVTATGLGLSGTDAGNYTVNSTATTTADITQRPLSTWSGAGGNALWSNPANWDALPDGANVAAVSIPAAGSVVFDASASATTLNSINSSGALSMSSGALQVNTRLNATSFAQSGGTLSGTGQFSVNGSFSQSGGSIEMNRIAITQASGPLSFSSLRGQTVELTSQNGAITQTGALQASSLVTQSTAGTLLNDAGNRIFSWLASNSGSGPIELTNAHPTGTLLDVQGIHNAGGDITLVDTGGISTSGAITAPAGKLSITTNSPLTVGSSGISSYGNIALTATNLTSAGNILLDGPISSTGGSVTITAANNLTQNSAVFGLYGVSASAGGTLTFGPNATSGNPTVSYTAASIAGSLPPTTVNGTVVYLPSLSDSAGLLTFMDDFQTLLANSPEEPWVLLGEITGNYVRPRIKDLIVTEGELCRP